MNIRSLIKLFIFSLLFPITVSAQSFGGTSFRPTGITGSLGFGVAEFSVIEPSSNFKLDQGVYAAVTGERGFESVPIYVTLSLNYMRSKGQANYNYSTLSGTEVYSDSDVNFTTTEFQIGLGLKLKFFESGWVRPYVEGGGLFGYNEIQYDITQTIRAQHSGNYKSKDALTSTGYYGEGGVEVDFSESFGIKAGFRYVTNLTRAFETLGNQKVRYNASIIKFGLIKKF